MNEEHAAVGEPLEESGTRLRVLLAACAGNGLEFYNVTIYAFVASTLAKLFFPAARPGVSLALAFGTFGISYVVRPLGGIVLGAYADRKGRRFGLLFSLSMMVAGTLVILLSPTYAQIGIWAPVLILISRLLQGFALGGEFGSVSAYLLERAPATRKSLYVSLQTASQGLGALLAAAVGWTVSHIDHAQMMRWGWRLPFLAGLLLAPIGLYLQRNLQDAREFLLARPPRHPMHLLFQSYWKQIALAASSTAVLSANIYLRVFLPSYAETQLGLPVGATYVLLLISGVTSIVLVPLIASRVTRSNVFVWMVIPTLVTMALIWPLLHMVETLRTMGAVVTMSLCLSILGATFSGPQAWFISTMFPTRVRAAGIGAGLNVGVLLFGGFAPALFASVAGGLVPFASAYLAVTGLITLLSILIAARSSHTVAEEVPGAV